MKSTALETERERLAAAALVFGLSAPCAYVLQRVVESLRDGHVDPSQIVQTAHVAFYWRAGIATWIGGLMAALAYARLRRLPAPERFTTITLCVCVLVALLAYQLP